MAIRQLQITLVLVAALALVASFTRLGFGFFNYALVEFGTDKPKPEPAEVTVANEKPSDDSYATDESSFAFRNAASLQQAIVKTKTQRGLLSIEQQQTGERLVSLKQRQQGLVAVVQQRRGELDNKLTAEQVEGTQRIQNLQTEKDELERRVAALRVTARDVEHQKATSAAQHQDTITPQVIECVQGAVVLLPQQQRIEISRLNGGEIAAYAKKNGVYFIVRPTGFDSFVAARNVARSAGTVVGYEPSVKGAGQ